MKTKRLGIAVCGSLTALLCAAFSIGTGAADAKPGDPNTYITFRGDQLYFTGCAMPTSSTVGASVNSFDTCGVDMPQVNRWAVTPAFLNQTTGGSQVFATSTLCMDTAREATSGGTPVVLAGCRVSSTQFWRLYANHLVNAASGLCLAQTNPLLHGIYPLTIERCAFGVGDFGQFVYLNPEVLPH